MKYKSLGVLDGLLLPWSLIQPSCFWFSGVVRLLAPLEITAYRFGIMKWVQRQHAGLFQASLAF